MADKKTFVASFLSVIFLLFVSFGGFYYNGRNLYLSCKHQELKEDDLQKNSLGLVCDYQVTFLGLTTQSGKNEELNKWNRGKYSLNFYFLNDRISLGFIGTTPDFSMRNEEVRLEPIRFQYEPFSIWILWIFCFSPSLGGLILALLILKKEFSLTKA